ncbi:MAG: hypothetical protein V3V78_03800 [Candidatus Woesearchaeota archaeon]
MVGDDEDEDKLIELDKELLDAENQADIALRNANRALAKTDEEIRSNYNPKPKYETDNQEDNNS